MCPAVPLVRIRQLEVVHVVLSEQGQVRLGLGQLGRVVQVHGRALGREHRGALRLGELRTERQRDRTELHQGVQQDDLLAARVQVSAAVPPLRTPYAASLRATQVASASSSA